MTDVHATLLAEQAEHLKTRARLKRVEEAYLIREENFLAWIAATKHARSQARRYRLAWMNARQRAAAFNDALIDANKERDALRAEIAMWATRYAEVCTALREVDR